MPSAAFSNILRALARGIERQGHEVSLVDARTEMGKSLTPYTYIAVGTVAPSLFSGHVAPEIGKFLKTAGMVSGKRSYAFLAGKAIRKNRILGSLMKVMEAEGMYLKRSDILKSPDAAEHIGSSLHI